MIFVCYLPLLFVQQFASLFYSHPGLMFCKCFVLRLSVASLLENVEIGDRGVFNNLINPIIGEVKLATINKRIVLHFIETLKAKTNADGIPYSEAYYKRAWTLFRASIRFAVKMGFLMDDCTHLISPRFVNVRKEKEKFERVIGRERRDKRDTAKRELLRDIIANKIPEDQLVTGLLSADKASFKQVKDFLLSENGGPKGQAAFNNLKAFVLRD